MQASFYLVFCIHMLSRNSWCGPGERAVAEHVVPSCHALSTELIYCMVLSHGEQQEDASMLQRTQTPSSPM